MAAECTIVMFPPVFEEGTDIHCFSKPVLIIDLGDAAGAQNGPNAGECHQSSTRGAFAGDAEQFFVQSTSRCAECLVDQNESV